MLVVGRAGLRSRAKRAASPSWGRGGWREEYYLQRALYVRPRGRGRLPFAGASPSVTEARVLRWTHDRTRGLRRMPSSYKAQPAFAPASVLQAASSKEGYPSGKRSLCSSSRARSVPARVGNRQNPPEMQKLGQLEGSRAAITRRARRTVQPTTAGTGTTAGASAAAAPASTGCPPAAWSFLVTAAGPHPQKGRAPPPPCRRSCSRSSRSTRWEASSCRRCHNTIST